MGAKRAVHKPTSRKGSKPHAHSRTAKERLSVEDQLRRARAGEAEARAQQAATAEILKVIASSPSDVQPVFDAIATSALRLFGGHSATVTRSVGDMIHGVALASTSEAGKEAARNLFPRPVSAPGLHATVLRTGKPAFRSDSQNDPDVAPEFKELARAQGFRSQLAVPMLRNGVAIGAIGVRRAEKGSFSDHQINLLKAFADQAVIAIENVRLFNETKEALERQTATADILKVIASSPSDVQPVFDAIVASALKLVGGLSAIMTRVVGEAVHLAAFTTLSGGGDDALKAQYPQTVSDGSFSARALIVRAPVQVRDIDTENEAPPSIREIARARGWRSALFVPMIRGDQQIGTINIARREPGAFSDHHVSLLKTFADQAVIAIENVRLFNETKEALERQTATAEILKVIASSPSDVQPVFDAIAKASARLIGGFSATVFRYEGDLMYLAALTSTSPSGDEYLRRMFPRPRSDSLSDDALRNGRVSVCTDTETDTTIAPEARELARARGWQSRVMVPMLREGAPIGFISVTRVNSGSFSDHEIGLLKTFADQAVIAIENVRLFNETKEALERQTATAEILKVISSSPTDVQPVFDAIVTSARQLIGGFSATVARVIDNSLHLAAFTARDHSEVEALKKFFPVPISRGYAAKVMISTRLPVYVSDIEADSRIFSEARELARARGYRSVLHVPMVREGTVIGTINVTRREPGPFSDRHIDLLKTFAEQAVIAIENVRLFNETKEALERQTATGEILRVIASSPSDVQPVFEAIAQSAHRLFDCGAAFQIVRDGALYLGAFAGHSKEETEQAEALYPMAIDGAQTKGLRAMLEGKILETTDIEAPHTPPAIVAIGRAAGFRSLVSVPLLRGTQLIGQLSLSAKTVRAKLNAKQIDLLKTFADQAVIAIENVRLFNETKEALEQQTATADILKVISSSPTDIQPVFDAIAESAARLCGANDSMVRRVDGDVLRLAAHYGSVPIMQEVIPIAPGWVLGRAFLERQTIHVHDMDEEQVRAEYPDSGTTSQYGRWRTILAVPLLREGSAIGTIAIRRRDAHPFSDNQIKLLKTFADQAVIAIENVRLFKELQARTEALSKSVSQLTALGEVGQAISSSLDLETVLKTIVQRAVQLTGLDSGSVYEYDELSEEFELRATENVDVDYLALLSHTPIQKGEGAVGRTGLTGEPTQIPDVQERSYQSRLREGFIKAGYRAILVVPMLREEHIIGALTVSRKTSGPFADEVVELLKTFATQSAMAIQNARLFREIAEKGKQLEIASQHKSQFLASMSHELRTPLNAILGFNEMMLDGLCGEVPEGFADPLNEVQTSGKHLLRLINNVLDLAKIEAGRMELVLADYSVQDLVEGVRSTLRSLAAEKGLEFLVTVPVDLPLAHGDSGRLTQCLINLAGNSLKFTKEGKVEVSVSQRENLLVFRVADTGIGIAPDKIGSLFTEFKQTDATIATEYGGSGLGLSIVKKFVEMHGGRIWTESELGKGSTFIFEIPVRAQTRTA